MSKQSIIAEWGLYVIVDVNVSREKSHVQAVEEAAKGGAKVIQLREKNLSYNELVPIANRCRKIAHEHGAAFIVNDDPKLAREVHADGVHIGQNDIPLSEARTIIGDDKIIGFSTHTQDQLAEALVSDADYLALGPVFPTLSKKSEYKPVGTKLLKWAVSNCPTPVVAIGGITFRNIDMVLKSGVNIVAVISAVMDSGNITRTTQQLVNVVQSFRSFV